MGLSMSKGDLDQYRNMAFPDLDSLLAKFPHLHGGLVKYADGIRKNQKDISEAQSSVDKLRALVNEKKSANSFKFTAQAQLPKGYEIQLEPFQQRLDAISLDMTKAVLEQRMRYLNELQLRPRQLTQISAEHLLEVIIDLPDTEAERVTVDHNLVVLWWKFKADSERAMDSETQRDTTAKSLAKAKKNAELVAAKQLGTDKAIGLVVDDAVDKKVKDLQAQLANLQKIVNQLPKNSKAAATKEAAAQKVSSKNQGKAKAKPRVQGNKNANKPKAAKAAEGGKR